LQVDAKNEDVDDGEMDLNVAQPNVTSNNDTSFLKAAGSHLTQPTQCWNADSLMESAVQQIFTPYNAIQLSNQFSIL